MIMPAQDEFEKIRKEMIELQLKARGIKNEAVLNAFYKVPREYFVMDEHYELAYDDSPLPLISGQTISQPYVVALMTEMLELPTDTCCNVLEVGTGSGYQAAILATMGHNVVTVERLDELLELAKSNLKQLPFANFIKLCLGDGCLGWVDDAPFDGIIVTAASPTIPKDLVNQLDVGAKIVLPNGDVNIQQLIQATKLKNGTLDIVNHGGYNLFH